MPYYDDNYGHWDIEDEDDIRHYHKTQRTNVMKKCVCCKQMVCIQPHYDKCGKCADKIENGWDF